MSEELKNVCENCGFDSDFQELLKGMEEHYMVIAKNEEQDCDEDQLTMTQWILENTKVKELNCLSEKEKFLYGLGVLSSEIMNY